MADETSEGMTDPRVQVLIDVADRLSAMADVADLMDDAAGSERLRAQAAQRRWEAMALLDQVRPTGD